MLGRHWGGFSAPKFCYPLQAHARLEQNAHNLRWLGQQMCEHRMVHLVLALHNSQIEVLAVSHYSPCTLWLEGCVPVLLEAHELESWATAPNCQLELLQCFDGVFAVRIFEENSHKSVAQ
jgi:hypothetical protein